MHTLDGIGMKGGYRYHDIVSRSCHASMVIMYEGSQFMVVVADDKEMNCSQHANLADTLCCNSSLVLSVHGTMIFSPDNQSILCHWIHTEVNISCMHY